ncbi:MAG: PINc domain-containing protein [Thermoanaerobacterium thermosaccharolyticum]
MRVINFPFKNANFSRGTSVFIDACFLLTLLDNKNRKYNDSINVSQQLLNNNCQLYISPIVSAETVNKLILILFIKDVKTFMLNINETLNDKENLKLIVATFSEKDKDILTKNIKNYPYKINFKDHFDKIYKAGNSNLLEVYFQNAIKLEKILENKLHIKYVSINKQTVINARDYISQDLMGVNDAFHIAIAVQNNIDYLLTLDKDFKRIKCNSKVSILKI